MGHRSLGSDNYRGCLLCRLNGVDEPIDHHRVLNLNGETLDGAIVDKALHGAG